MVAQIDAEQAPVEILGRRRAAGLPQAHVGEEGHAPARAASELDLLVPAEQPKAELDDRARAGRARDGVCPKLDLAVVEPLPDLEVSLAGLDVPVEGSVVPEEDVRRATAFAAFAFPGPADADARIDAGAEHVQDQQHLPPLQWYARVVVRLDERRIGKCVAAAERHSRLPAAAGGRWARLLGLEWLPVG